MSRAFQKPALSLLFDLFLTPSDHLPPSPPPHFSFHLFFSHRISSSPPLTLLAFIISSSRLPPPSFVSPPFLPPLPLFCRFINVLPTGVPWRQAAKGVATATHRRLWSPRRVVRGEGGGGVVRGGGILSGVEALEVGGGGGREIES